MTELKFYRFLMFWVVVGAVVFGVKKYGDHRVEKFLARRDVQTFGTLEDSKLQHQPGPNFQPSVNPFPPPLPSQGSGHQSQNSVTRHPTLQLKERTSPPIAQLSPPQRFNQSQPVTGIQQPRTTNSSLPYSPVANEPPSSWRPPVAEKVVPQEMGPNTKGNLTKGYRFPPPAKPALPSVLKEYLPVPANEVAKANQLPIVSSKPDNEVQNAAQLSEIMRIQHQLGGSLVASILNDDEATDGESLEMFQQSIQQLQDVDASRLPPNLELLIGVGAESGDGPVGIPDARALSAEQMSTLLRNLEVVMEDQKSKDIELARSCAKLAKRLESILRK